MDDVTPDFVLEGVPAPCETIIAGVAERADEDPMDLPPLYEAVDPDAIDTIVRDGRSVQVTFEYAGYEITVAGPNDVAIHERSHDPPAG